MQNLVNIGISRDFTVYRGHLRGRILTFRSYSLSITYAKKALYYKLKRNHSAKQHHFTASQPYQKKIKEVEHCYIDLVYTFHVAYLHTTNRKVRSTFFHHNIGVLMRKFNQ